MNDTRQLFFNISNNTDDDDERNISSSSKVKLWNITSQEVVATTTAMSWVQNDAYEENISEPTITDTPGLVMYPSLKNPDTAVFTVASIYLICFVIGICGNASTLTVIFGLGTPQGNRRKSSISTMSSTSDCFRIYVAALCIVDTLVLLSLPWAIVDSLIGFWIFGTAACKIHHLFGSVGRIASTLLITAMSIDRYLIVAYPQTFGTRSAKTTTIVVAALFGLAFAVLLPLLIFAQAQSLVVYQGNHSTAGHLTIRVFKCVDGMPINLLFWFTGSTFFVGYVCPMFVITLFNIGLLLKIRKHQRKISIRSMIPMKRVTAYIAAIASFYFLCWTPYWAGVVYVSYVDLFETRELRELTNASEKTMLVLYCAHIFPYINTAVNWFLYGRLASNLSRTRQSNTTIQCSNSRNGIFPGSENSPPIRVRPGIPLSSSAGDTQNLLSHPEAILHNSEVTRNGDFWSTNVSKFNDIKATHHRKITS